MVDEGNGKFNLILLCWGEGHASPVHDHADSHCFMKMLQGELCEIRYEWPSKIDENANNSEKAEENMDESELKEKSRTILELNGVYYINDNLGLHRVENPSHVNTSVSLHLYCPPFNSCQVFNKQTGKSTKCDVTFWSKYGKRLKDN